MSNETEAQRRSFKPFAFGIGCGCLLGVLVTGSLAAFFAWAYLTAEEEWTSNPLAELKVPAGKLSFEEAKPFVDQLASGYLEDSNNVGLVVALIRDDKSSVLGYGETARESSVRPDGKTLFEIASVGKTFTTTVLAEMALRDELKLEDPLSGFLPAGNKERIPQHGSRVISLLDLATHTSGLPSLPPNFTFKDPLNPYKDYSVDEMLAGLAKIQLPRSPGEEYEYSNLGFGLLGYALAKRVQMDFEELVIQRLCEPLAMHDSRMTLSPELKARLATPHDQGKPVPVWEDTTMPGAGSFLSTADDLTRFVQAHWQDHAEPNSLRRAMTITVQKHRRGGSPEESVGLGWHISSQNALDIIWHNGGSGGSASYVAFLIPQKVGVLVLSNSSNPVDELGLKLLYLLAWH